MPKHQWSPPHHPDPRMPRIVEMAPDPDAVELDPHVVEGHGVERCVGFAFKASDLAVYVQPQYLGRTHRVWVERSRVAHRRITR